MIAIAVLFTVPLILWLAASWLLVRSWWEGGGARISMLDTPGQVLAAVVATLPKPRRPWGEAMLCELAGQSGRRHPLWTAASTTPGTAATARQTARSVSDSGSVRSSTRSGSKATAAI